MKYHGSCHCGRVAYDVETEMQTALACNCSMCQRNVRCLEGIDLEPVPVRHYDGRSR